MEQTHPQILSPEEPMSLFDTISHLHTRLPENTPNLHKYSKKLFIISNFITFSSLIWSIINSYYFSSNFYTKLFFLLIFGFLPFLPFMLLFFFLPFFLHRVFRTKTLLALLIAFDIVVTIVAVLLKDLVLGDIIFFPFCFYVPFINILSIYTLIRQPLRVLLYTVTADILYPTKLLLFKTLFKQICFNLFRRYYNSAAFIIHIMNLINKKDKQKVGYLILSMGMGILMFLYNFLVYVLIVKPEFNLFGFLLCINNTKRKLHTNTTRNKFNNRDIGVHNNNNKKNTFGNELNYLDVKQSLTDLEDKEIEKNFFVQPRYPYYFKYGPTPMDMPTDDNIEIVSREMVEAFKKISLGFPIHVFNTEGSLVYSKLNNTDIKQATNTFITKSFYNGFIGLIKDRFNFIYHSMMSLTAHSNIVFITGLLVILYLIRHPSDCSIAIFMHVIVLFTYLVTGTDLIKATNSIILGYSHAMLYLLIGEQIELRNELKYERKLKRKLNEMCERDKII